MSEQDFEFSIYVPGAVPAPENLPPDEASEHSLLGRFRLRGNVVSVRAEEVRGQWQNTLDTVLALNSAIEQCASAWAVDEIEVGLTLSARGHLLFIAEAGAEASIKITLKPKSLKEAS